MSTIDPDVTRRNDPAYWAAAMVLAIRSGDQERVATARQRLQQLGYRLEAIRATDEPTRGEGVADGQ